MNFFKLKPGHSVHDLGPTVTRTTPSVLCGVQGVAARGEVLAGTRYQVTLPGPGTSAFFVELPAEILLPLRAGLGRKSRCSCERSRQGPRDPTRYRHGGRARGIPSTASGFRPAAACAFHWSLAQMAESVAWLANTMPEEVELRIPHLLDLASRPKRGARQRRSGRHRQRNLPKGRSPRRLRSHPHHPRAFSSRHGAVCAAPTEAADKALPGPHQCRGWHRGCETANRRCRAVRFGFWRGSLLRPGTAGDRHFAGPDRPFGASYTCASPRNGRNDRVGARSSSIGRGALARVFRQCRFEPLRIAQNMLYRPCNYYGDSVLCLSTPCTGPLRF